MMRCLLFAVAAAASTITPEQASKLRSLGYRASEIAAIRPSVASVVARRGLPRPKAGMPPSWVVDDADLAPVARPRPLAGVVGLLQKLAFSVSMLARDLAEVTRRAALPVGVVLVASQADRIRSTLGTEKPSSGEEGYFLFDGPNDPAMRGAAKVRISPASMSSNKT